MVNVFPAMTQTVITVYITLMDANHAINCMVLKMELGYALIVVTHIVCFAPLITIVVHFVS